MKKTNNNKKKRERERRESWEVTLKDETLAHGWVSDSPGFIKMDIGEKEEILQRTACMRSAELKDSNGPFSDPVTLKNQDDKHLAEADIIGMTVSATSRKVCYKWAVRRFNV